MNIPTNERYYSLSTYLKITYNEKMYKLALDGGFTCPNRDGLLDTRGCIFCSEGGSGDFASSKFNSITAQLEQSKLLVNSKIKSPAYIAYFQAFTNTYGSVTHLESLYNEAMADPEVKIISIATRPDCLDPSVVALLGRLNRIKPIWIELGLQSQSEASGEFIRRGYPLSQFEIAVTNLRSQGITVIVHTIIGLPSEGKNGILDTIEYLNTCDIQGIKLQLLHVLKHTDLATIYEKEPFWLPTLDEYLEILGTCINYLRPDIVVHRITGDGPKNLLIAPLWSANKRLVLNSISKYFKTHNIQQGKYYIN